MRALLQRVLEAKVVVDAETTGEIQHGVVVFLGLAKEDNLEKGKKLIDKILKYRFFDDEQGKMGWNVAQAGGGLLLVSQFTLMAQTQKGLRPDFGPAMPPNEAKVVVDGEITGEIQQGILVFLGLGKDDNFEKGKKLIDKILKYRFFDDEQGKMGWNVSQANGSVLLVSQFTLMAQTQKGLRPDFGPAMPPNDAKALYEQLVDYAKSQFNKVETGIFAADMKVHLVNDGPVTFCLEVE